MGVPKFFRAVVERWPLVYETLEGDEGRKPPVIDNLMLDSNGFIHAATHGTLPDGVSSGDLSDEERVGLVLA